MGISREEALDCFRSDDLVGIGMEADAVRRRLHPEGVVSYAVSAQVDITPVLRAAKDGSDAETLLDRMCEDVGAQVAMGATVVHLTGTIGVKSEAGLQWLEGMVREVRRQFPASWIEGLPAEDIAAVAGRTAIPAGELVARLRDAGLDAIAGDGVAAGQAVDQWAAVHKAAHALGMRTVATMVFGAGETLEQRVDFLEAVRRLQQETGGFTAFVPTAAAGPGGRDLDAATAVERLKTLAISRMFLDNIENVQSSRAGQGLKVLQTGLRFGANDVGTVDAGAENGASEEDLRLVIRDAGFRPVERDAPYRTMFLD